MERALAVTKNTIMANYFLLKESQGTLPGYFKDWLHGMIAMATLDHKEAKKYPTRAAYKKDLAKLKRQQIMSGYKAVEIEVL